jgi:flagellar biosynthesis/type III secretory pathway protein FliH
MWIDRERGIVDAGMYERLRAFRETTLRVTEKFDESAARVHDQLGDLPDGIAGPAMAKFETLIAEVKAQLKDAAAQAAAALDDAAATATPDAVKRDLDRSRLRALVAAG